MIDRLPAADRATWLKLREHDVTASVAAALVGAHPFITPFELWQLKAGKIGEDPEESPAMQRGRLLEPVAVKLLQERRPDWIVKHNTGRAQLYWRDGTKRIGATPDVLVDVDGKFGTVQIKSVDPFAFEKAWLVEGKLSKPASWQVEPPLYVVIQAMVEAYLTGAEIAFVTPLVVMHGLEMPIVEIPIRSDVIERIEDEVAEFWASIAAGCEPDPDWKKDAALLSELGRTDNGREIDLSGDNLMPELLARRLAAKERIKVDEKIVEECDGEIVAKIGAFERAHVPGWSVKRPTISRKAYEVKAGSYRRLDVKQL